MGCIAIAATHSTMSPTSPGFFSQGFMSSPMASYTVDTGRCTTWDTQGCHYSYCFFSVSALQDLQVNPAQLVSPEPGRSLKLCPLETAQKILKEKSAEVLCSELKDLGERYSGDHAKVHGPFLEPISLRRIGKSSCCFPYIKDSYLSESQLM